MLVSVARRIRREFTHDRRAYTRVERLSLVEGSLRNTIGAREKKQARGVFREGSNGRAFPVVGPFAKRRRGERGRERKRKEEEEEEKKKKRLKSRTIQALPPADAF